MPSEFAINRQRLVQIFFFATFGFLLYQLFVVSKPFLPGMLGSMMLAMAFYPLFSRVKRIIKNKSLAALVLTLGVLLVAVIPVFWTGVVVTREASHLIPTAREYVEAAQQGDWWSVTEKLPPSLRAKVERIANRSSDLGFNLQPKIMSVLSRLGTTIVSFGAGLARNILIVFFNGLVLLVTLFFFFRDGEALLQWLLGLIPMEEAHKQMLAKRAYDTFRAVAVGVFVTAAAQGFVAMIGFGIAGVKLPFLLGVATMFSSFLGATFIVTVPVGLLVLKNNLFWGGFLLIWGMFVVGLMDNFLKPLLIGSRARMPFILILFSIVGGVKAYGVLGFFLGPILVASLLAFIKIYREEYGRNG